jgi:preprotein translocase subunit SecE
MNIYVKLGLYVVIVGGIFALLWRGGQLVRLSNYIRGTREELDKCTWPTWAELKGSTVVIMIAMALLGGFTYAVDSVFFAVFHLLP